MDTRYTKHDVPLLMAISQDELQWSVVGGEGSGPDPQFVQVVLVYTPVVQSNTHYATSCKFHIKVCFQTRKNALLRLVFYLRWLSHIKVFKTLKRDGKHIYLFSLTEKFWIYESQALCPAHYRCLH